MGIPLIFSNLFFDIKTWKLQVNSKIILDLCRGILISLAAKPQVSVQLSLMLLGGSDHLSGCTQIQGMTCGPSDCFWWFTVNFGSSTSVMFLSGTNGLNWIMATGFLPGFEYIMPLYLLFDHLRCNKISLGINSEFLILQLSLVLLWRNLLDKGWNFIRSRKKSSCVWFNSSHGHGLDGWGSTDRLEWTRVGLWLNKLIY